MQPTNEPASYWLSRRPKYTPVQILRIAQEYLLERMPDYALRILELAVGKGHEEIDWLFELLENKLPTYSANCPFNAWANRLFDDDDDLSFCYQFWISSHKDNCGPIRPLTNDRHPIAQYILGLSCEEQLSKAGNREAKAWYLKSAEQDFSPAILRLAIYSVFDTESLPNPESKRLLLRAVGLGNVTAIRQVSRDSEIHGNELYGMTDVELAMIHAKHYLMFGRHSNPIFPIITDAMIQLGSPKYRSKGVQILYRIGEVLADSEPYHAPFSRDSMPTRTMMIDIYRQMSSRARKAAVQTILALRSIGVCRDVVIVIAKLVYASRSDAEWYLAAK